MKNKKRVIQHIIFVTTLLVFLAGCAVAPPYHAPKQNLPHGFTANKLPSSTQSIAVSHGGNIQHFSSQAPIGEWWKTFDSPMINKIMAIAFQNNPTLKSARHTLKQNQYLLKVAAAGYFPTLGAGINATRQQTGPQLYGPSNIYDTYTGQLTVGYNPDVFGRTYYTKESASALKRQARYNLNAAYETLAGNLANALILAAGYKAQINASHSIIHAQEQALELVKTEYKLGATSYVNVLTQETQVQTSKASLLQLQQQLATTRHQIAILAGQFPAHFHLKLPHLDQLVLPGNIPTGIPSQLVQSRPDIKAAQSAIHAAYGQYGLAYAERFPSFAITAAFGRSIPRVADIGHSIFNIWSIALNASATLFDAGALKNKAKAAKEAYLATTENYKQTVLLAFEQVANSLRSLQYDAQILKTRKIALDAAEKSLELTLSEYKSGQIGYQTLLTAQIQESQSRISYLQALQQRYLDTAALFVALGGRAWPTHNTNQHAH